MPSNETLEQVLERYGSAIVKRTKEQMLKGQMRVNSFGQPYRAVPTSTGTLLKSVKWSAKYFGKYWEFKITAEDYFGALDEGRSPTGKGKYSGKSGKPMPSLYSWVKNKNLIAQKNRGIKELTKKRRKLISTSKKLTDFLERNQKALAFQIERKIHRKGFKGYGFFKPYIEGSNILKLMKYDIEKAIGKEIQLDIETIAKKV